MPGIEGIRKEAGGIMRWMVKAEVPIIGAVEATFTVEKTEDSPERLEWSPARSEMKNYLRYAAAFEERGHKVRSEEHTSELQSQSNLVCRLLLEKKKKKKKKNL